MLDKAQIIEQKVQTLGSWINEMKTLSANPYANGLNVERMLRDLEGFTNDLAKDIHDLTQDLTTAEKPQEAEKAE